MLSMGAARRIWGILYRHLSLYRRSWPRLLEIAYWPTVQMLIWGFTSTFLSQLRGGTGVLAGALLGGVLLWEVALRSQMGFSVTFLEEIWSRNLGHLFVSPLRPAEFLLGLIIMSILRTAIGIIPAAVLAWVLYRFNLLNFGPVIVLLIGNLMVMGWWVALSVIALILRHGVGAEALAWSVLFGLAPLSAVFYPVSVFPAWLRPIPLLLPSTHVFEGMRALLASGTIRWHDVFAASLLNIVWMVAAIALFTWQFHRVRLRGALISIGE